MAVNTEERKVTALENMVQMLEHHTKATPEVLAARHSADCLDCMEFRAAAAEKVRVAAEAKANPAEKVSADKAAAERKGSMN